MGKWKPAPAHWARAFEGAMPERPEIEPRKMFGYPCAFAHGHLVVGLHEAGLIVRLPERDRADFAKLGATPFAPMPGRTMKEYSVAPEPLALDTAALRSWLERAFDYVATLPPKERKARTAGPSEGTKAKGRSGAKKPATKKPATKKPATGLEATTGANSRRSGRAK